MVVYGWSYWNDLFSLCQKSGVGTIHLPQGEQSTASELQESCIASNQQLEDISVVEQYQKFEDLFEHSPSDRDQIKGRRPRSPHSLTGLLLPNTCLFPAVVSTTCEKPLPWHPPLPTAALQPMVRFAKIIQVYFKVPESIRS